MALQRPSTGKDQRAKFLKAVASRMLSAQKYPFWLYLISRLNKVRHCRACISRRHGDEGSWVTRISPLGTVISTLPAILQLAD